MYAASLPPRPTFVLLVFLLVLLFVFVFLVLLLCLLLLFCLPRLPRCTQEKRCRKGAPNGQRHSSGGGRQQGVLVAPSRIPVCTR